MPRLENILQKVSILEIVGNQEVKISGISFDSRKVYKENLFVAIKGTCFDGHQFIDKAIDSGASVIVYQDIPLNVHPKTTYVKVVDSTYALSQMAANFYENPSQKLKLIGITGTNGKTTVASLLYQFFRKQDKKTGLLSTVQILINDAIFPATHTTPDALSLQYYLHQMVKSGVEYCFMEVSSHAIHQKRVAHLQFDGAIFTNLSQDHLDYHKTFMAYRDVKKEMFDNLSSNAFALVNLDDKNGYFMLQNTLAKKVSFALKNDADFTGKILEKSFEGMLLKIKNKEVWVSLTGQFNAYNLLAVFATAKVFNFSTDDILSAMSLLQNVSGRFDYFTSKTGLVVVIDYAHTPEALRHILQTIKEIKSSQQRLFTVVGCGGNRDVDKRSKMGNISVQLSNFVIFTSDNPRDEDPQDIIIQMQRNIDAKHQNKIFSITDRKQAIKSVCVMANSDDIILIAGKGHENYQEIKGKRYEFNDKKIATQILTALEK